MDFENLNQGMRSLYSNEIRKYIEGKPEISQKAVHNDELNADEAEKLINSDKNIEGSNTENHSIK